MSEKKSIYVFESVVNEAAKKYANEVLDSGWIGLGKKVEEFEEKVADYLGCKYAVALNSATAGLHLAMIASGIEKGDRVVTTPMTFVSTNAAILYVGAKPVFVDVCDKSLSINIDDAVTEMIASNIKNIVLVHYGGNPISKKSILKIKNIGDVNIIHDMSHCFGSMWGNKVDAVKILCNFDDDMAVFSFHAVKNLASPDGGIVTTNDELVAKELKKLRWMGIDKDTYSRFSEFGYSWQYEVDQLGYKYHMNDLTAAILLGHLETIDEDNAFRRNIKDNYEKYINANFVKGSLSDIPSAHLVVMKHEKRNRIFRMLKERDIHCGVHYTPNNHYKLFKEYPNSTPICDEVYEQIMTLPCHLKMTDVDVERVINETNEIIETAERDF